MTSDLKLWDKIGLLFNSFCLFQNQLLILFPYVFRRFDPNFSAETEYPAIENAAYGCVDGGIEGPVAVCFDRDAFAEFVDQRIHNAVVAYKLHFSFLSAVHTEHGVQVCIQIETFRRLNCILIKNIRLLDDSIQTEAAYSFVLFGIADGVIVVAVPNQLVRTENVNISVVLWLFSFARII